LYRYISVAKHTPELAQLIVSNGGVAALVDYVNESESNNRLPGIMVGGAVQLEFSCDPCQRARVEK
jgi:hypothetical protein